MRHKHLWHQLTCWELTTNTLCTCALHRSNNVKLVAPKTRFELHNYTFLFHCLRYFTKILLIIIYHCQELNGYLPPAVPSTYAHFAWILKIWYMIGMYNQFIILISKSHLRKASCYCLVSVSSSLKINNNNN